MSGIFALRCILPPCLGCGPGDHSCADNIEHQLKLSHKMSDLGDVWGNISSFIVPQQAASQMPTQVQTAT